MRLPSSSAIHEPTDSSDYKENQTLQNDHYQKYISVEDYKNNFEFGRNTTYDENDHKEMMKFYKDTLVDHRQEVINNNTIYSSIIMSQATETVSRDGGNDQDNTKKNMN